MSVVIPSDYKYLEPGPLASMDLLLHGCSLQNLVLEGCPQEKDNDLRFLDGQREEVDLLQGLDLHVLDQRAPLGIGEPLLGLGLTSKITMVFTPALTLAATLALDTTAKVSTEATTASYSRAPGSSGPSHSTGLSLHLVFLRRSLTKPS